MSKEALENFPDLSKHHSFMKQHMTKEIYAAYYGQKTNNGVTLDHCIQTGIDDPTLDVGMVAGDAESYTKFKDVFFPVVKSYHNGYDPSKDTHPLPDVLDPDAIPDTPLDDKYIISSRMRIGRSIGDFAFAPSCTRRQRREVERIATEALKGLTGEIKGEYHPISGMTPEEEEKLISDHYLFAKPASDFMRNAGMGRDWPDSRGIYYNEGKTFLVWVNEEDHLRIVSMQKGADFKAVFTRFCQGVNQMRKQLKVAGHNFQSSPSLGYLCTCPTNLGTSLRCSVHIKLTKLCEDPRFKDIVKKLRLDKRGTGGEYRASAGPDIFDLSNLDRLGKTESELVQLVYNAVKLLIEMEKRLEAGKSIDDLVPK